MKARILILSLALASAACSEAPPGTGDGGQAPTPDGLQADAPGPVDAGPDGTDQIGGEDDVLSPPDVAMEVVQEPNVVTGLVITPASSMAVQVQQGVSQPLGLGAALVYSHGDQIPVSADEIVWTFSDSTIATVGEDSSPEATGFAGGQVLIVAIHAGLHAQCSLTVQLLIPDPVLYDGLDPAEVMLFESGEVQVGEAGPELIYPLDQSVLPRGMKPPLFQWNSGGNTAFRLIFTGAQGFTITLYTTQTSFQPTLDHWTALAGPVGSDVSVALTGTPLLAPGGDLFEAEEVSLEIADADLSGSVYYWAVNTGSIMRLDANPFEPVAEPVFTDSGGMGSGKTVCRGCHTLSQDGSRLAYVLEAKGSGDLGVSWAQNPEPPIVAAGSGALASTASFGPDATRLAIATEARLWLADVTPGIEGGYTELQEIFVAPGPSSRVMTPAWSPDGSALVYAYSAELTSGESDLLLRFQDEETGLFGAPQVLLEGALFPERGFLAYPTWSPDSQFLVTRATGAIMGNGPFSLVMLNASGTQHVDLEAGSPPTFSHGQPSFSPFVEGGYYWLVFYSNRPYGAVKPGTQKQLWIMAIDQDAPLGTDPSHAPFWIPGQDVETINLSGYWAQPVCAHEGEICLTDADCCISNACFLDPEIGVAFCEDTGCTVPGQYCDAKSESCCAGYSCQQSLAGGFSCQTDSGLE